MSDAGEIEEELGEESPKKASKLPLILGLVLAIAGGGGGFFAVQMGLIGGGSQADDAHAETHSEPVADLPELAFVALEPLVISLSGHGARVHLRFAAQLEVDPAYAADVEALRPRITDVLNTYLRAVDIADLEDPTALIRLRSQMLRRVRIVAGEGRVNDLLIMEFVMN